MKIMDSELKQFEKVYKKKCIYIDWRYDNYYFGESVDDKLSDCEVLHSYDIKNFLTTTK